MELYMKIIIDDKIPYIKRGSENCRRGNLPPGKDFTGTDTGCGRTHHPDPHSLQPGIAGRQQSKNSSLRQPSGSTISTPNIASRQVSSGRMLRDAIPLR